MEDDELNPNRLAERQFYPAEVNIQRVSFSLYFLKNKYLEKRLVLDSSFQRSEVWEEGKQKSELIESILMGIPLPIVYFSENYEGVIQVVDGRQRLTTLFNFMDNGFRLTHLTVLGNLNGKSFTELTYREQSELEDYELLAYLIKPPTPDKIKFDIFDRVNRGGTRLNNQEMRNALYQGKSTDFLKSLSENKNFKNATNNAISSTRMKDRYFILRFISFYLWQEGKLLDRNGNLLEYKSDIDEFLGKSMEIINDFSDSELNFLMEVFEVSMKNAYRFLGENAFRIPSKSKKLRPISMAIFESFSYLMSFKFIEKMEKIRMENSINKLFNNPDFLASVTYNIESSISVNQRFLFINTTLKELRNDR